jgi:uncharacterized protein (TIGR03000 family)
VASAQAQFRIGIGIGIPIGPYYGPSYYPPVVVTPAPVVQPTPAYVPAPAAGYAPPATPAQVPAVAPTPATEKPSRDDAGHLQLMVPENAEVFIAGAKITQTGQVREIITPRLQVGTRYTYKISVRYANGQGQMVDDTREIRFQANDWFAINFTRPTPPPAAAPPK